MKITPKLNQASIGCFLKRMFLFLFIGILVCVIAGFIYLEHIDYDNIKYENGNQITTMFEENILDFENMVNLLKETDVLDELCWRWYLGQDNFIQPEGDTLSQPLIQLKNSGFVTKEQLEKIVVFFEKYGPAHVDVKSYVDAPVYSFCFYSNTHCVVLNYIDGADEDETELTIKRVLEFYGDDCDILKFNEHWFAALIKNSAE